MVSVLRARHPKTMKSHFFPRSSTLPIATTAKQAEPAAANTAASATAALDRMLEVGFSNGRPFSASVTWSASETAFTFNVGCSQEPRPVAKRPMIAATPSQQPPAVTQAPLPHAVPSHHQAPAQAPLHLPRPYAKSQPSAPTHAAAHPALAPGSMVTLRSRVKWFDGSKGFGVVNTNEPGHPDVFINDATLRAAGIANVRPGTPVIVTFDASHNKPKALVLQLA